MRFRIKTIIMDPLHVSLSTNITNKQGQYLLHHKKDSLTRGSLDLFRQVLEFTLIGLAYIVSSIRSMINKTTTWLENSNTWSLFRHIQSTNSFIDTCIINTGTLITNAANNFTYNHACAIYKSNMHKNCNLKETLIFECLGLHFYRMLVIYTSMDISQTCISNQMKFPNQFPAISLPVSFKIQTVYSPRITSRAH